MDSITLSKNDLEVNIPTVSASKKILTAQIHGIGNFPDFHSNSKVQTFHQTWDTKLCDEDSNKQLHVLRLSNSGTNNSNVETGNDQSEAQKMHNKQQHGKGSDPGVSLISANVVNERTLEKLSEEEILQLTREDCRRILKEKGMQRPSWNKAQATQQLLALKAMLPFGVEASPENAQRQESGGNSEVTLGGIPLSPTQLQIFQKQAERQAADATIALAKQAVAAMSREGGPRNDWDRLQFHHFSSLPVHLKEMREADSMDAESRMKVEQEKLLEQLRRQQDEEEEATRQRRRQQQQQQDMKLPGSFQRELELQLLGSMAHSTHTNSQLESLQRMVSMAHSQSGHSQGEGGREQQQEGRGGGGTISSLENVRRDAFQKYHQQQMQQQKSIDISQKQPHSLDLELGFGETPDSRTSDLLGKLEKQGSKQDSNNSLGIATQESMGGIPGRKMEVPNSYSLQGTSSLTQDDVHTLLSFQRVPNFPRRTGRMHTGPGGDGIRNEEEEEEGRRRRMQVAVMADNNSTGTARAQERDDLPDLNDTPAQLLQQPHSLFSSQTLPPASSSKEQQPSPPFTTRSLPAPNSLPAFHWQQLGKKKEEAEAEPLIPHVRSKDNTSIMELIQQIAAVQGQQPPQPPHAPPSALPPLTSSRSAPSASVAPLGGSHRNIFESLWERETVRRREKREREEGEEGERADKEEPEAKRGATVASGGKDLSLHLKPAEKMDPRTFLTEQEASASLLLRSLILGQNAPAVTHVGPVEKSLSTGALTWYKGGREGRVGREGIVGGGEEGVGSKGGFAGEVSGQLGALIKAGLLEGSRLAGGGELGKQGLLKPRVQGSGDGSGPWGRERVQQQKNGDSQTMAAGQQLTIIYGGNAHVYENVHVEKAQTIMMLASNLWETGAPNPLLPVLGMGSANPPHSESKAGTHPLYTRSISGPILPRRETSLLGGVSRSDAQVEGDSFPSRENSTMDSLRSLSGSGCLGTQIHSPQGVGPDGKTRDVEMKQVRQASLAKYLEKRKQRLKGKTEGISIGAKQKTNSLEISQDKKQKSPPWSFLTTPSSSDIGSSFLVPKSKRAEEDKESSKSDESKYDDQMEMGTDSKVEAGVQSCKENGVGKFEVHNDDCIAEENKKALV